MQTPKSPRETILAAAQGATTLHLAFLGVSNGMFDALASGPLTPSGLAAKVAIDPAYALRWCEAAYAFELLDRSETAALGAGGTEGGEAESGEHAFSLTALGAAFRPSEPGSLMPFAVQSVLGAHMAERMVALMKTGERPGERILAERPAILPWFGPMLEASFASFFEQHIARGVDAYRELDERGGVAVDLGCGNGWYLRKLVARYPHIRGLGLDGFDENIRHATEAAAREGLSDRLSFRAGDIHDFKLDEPVAMIAMNRALHHVWDRKESVFEMLSRSLLPGGAVVVWEPRWPDDTATLRDPKRRMMANQNLGEHVQGNHFLRPAEIEAAMTAAGLTPRTYLFGEGNEAVVVGKRPE